MYKLLFTLLIGSFSSIYFCLVYAQLKEELYVKKIDTKNGLPSSIVYYTFEDSKGFIWIATSNGIAKYNGYDFEYYTNENGLTNNNVFFITEDPKTGYIWFNAFKGGICYYDGDEMLEHPLNNEIKSICKNSWVSTFCIDSLGNFWFTSTNREPHITSIDYNFYKIPTSNDTILAIDPPTASAIFLAQNTYIKLCDSIGEFAVLRAGSVASSTFDTSLQVKELPQLQEPFLQNSIGKVFRLKNGKILGYNGIELVVFDEQTVYHSSNYWNKGLIHQICQVEGGDVFVCTSKGVHILDEKYNYKQTFLKDYSISHVLRDRDGNYWFSTTNDGILITSSLDLKEYFKDEVVARIEIGTDSSIWVSTYDENLYKFVYDSIRNTFNSTRVMTKNQRTYSLVIPISATKEEKLPSFNKKVTSTERDSLMTFFLGAPKHTKALGWTNNNNIMIGYSNGFSIYNDLNKTNIFNSIDIGFTEWVKVIVQDIYDHYWIGTIKGLYFLPSLDVKPIYMGNRDNCLKRTINDIAQSSTGQIWVATAGSGVLVMKNENIYYLSKKTGLSSNVIQTLFIENDSSIWLGTNKGIDHVSGNFQNPKIDYYNIENGFPINDIRIIKEAKQYLFVGGNKGLTVFKKRSYVTPISYKTYLHHVEVNNEPITAQTNYTFNNQENNLVFHFRTICFNKQQEYYYRLIGIDSLWQNGKTNAVRYNKLPHGHYTFEVKVKDSPILRVPFRIRAHFTQTWLFRGIMVIFCLSIVMLTIVYFFKKQRQKILKQRQMNDLESKVLRSQMNPHFIFNAMNSIMFLIMNNNTNAAQHYLYHFSKLMRLVLENSKHNFIQLKDEITTIKSYLELEKLRYGSQIKIHWDFIETREMYNYKIPPMLVQPIVENALLHGLRPKKDNGNLWLHFFEDKKGLYIVIEDDGIGRKAAANITINDQESNAIKNIKNRIKNINIIYQTALSFHIEDLYKNKESSGTKVTFFIPQNYVQDKNFFL